MYTQMRACWLNLWVRVLICKHYACSTQTHISSCSCVGILPLPLTSTLPTLVENFSLTQKVAYKSHSPETESMCVACELSFLHTTAVCDYRIASSDWSFKCPPAFPRSSTPASHLALLLSPRRLH